MKVKLQEGDYVAFCYEEFSDRVGPISLGYELHQLREGKLEQSLMVRGWDRQEIENARFNFVADVTRKKIDTLYTIVDLGYNEFLGIKGHEEDEPENPEADYSYIERKVLDEKVLRELHREEVETIILRIARQK